jgi:PncC family amidohydrolase
VTGTPVIKRLADIARVLSSSGRTVSVAESCTGGLLGGELTSVSGSSRWFLGGVIAYSNDVKTRDLGVPPAILEAEGAVSEPTARQMAIGVRRKIGSDIGIGVTGVAGPDGGTPEKPVGLVYVSLADGENCRVERLQLGGGRENVRRETVSRAIDMLWKQVCGPINK